MREYRVEVYKVIKWKDGCVYRTKVVKSIWLPIKSRTAEENLAIAKEHGGDGLAATMDYR